MRMLKSRLHNVKIQAKLLHHKIWYNTKIFGMIPNVFGFLGFWISANTKNANPKLSLFILVYVYSMDQISGLAMIALLHVSYSKDIMWTTSDSLRRVL